MTGQTPDGSPGGPPEGRRLGRATLGAAAAALLILVTIVWPAEFGRDPLGTGRALGIYRALPDPTSAPDRGAGAGEASAANDAPQVRGTAAGLQLTSPRPYRTDTMSLTLRSGEGGEIKAAMRQGEVMVFSWTATGEGVDVDMHGDFTDGPPGNYTGYWKDEFQTASHGAFTAPATGNHGWFWQNLTDVPVTVTVTVSGFYEKLFQP